MSGLALMVSSHHVDVQRRSVERMIDAVPHRCTDGKAVAVTARCALGFARRATSRVAADADWPWHDASDALWVVADLRLDNREELRDQLFVGADESDGALLLAGYRRWQHGLADHLVGDFALLIWDGAAESLYAARDPFGVRPLYFHRANGCLAFASEVEQLLTLEHVAKRIDDRAVADYLTGEARYPRSTFFRDVERVEPGHWLLARHGAVSQQRYWQPPAGEQRRLSRAECLDEFRRRFFRGVRDRLGSQRPVVAQLSGGLDSSAIVGAAWQLVQDGVIERDACHLASAVYPGLPCDESRFIDAVCRHAQFPHEQWDGTETEKTPSDDRLPAHPWGMGKFGSVAGDWRIAHRLQARVILSGFGGDELLFERGVFADLAAAGRWLELLQQCRLAPRYSTRSARFFLFGALRALVPAPLRRLYRRALPAPAKPVPSWWGEKLRGLAEVGTDDGPTAAPRRFASHTQQTTWNWLTQPGFLLALEWQVHEAARQGLELRFPYLDRRLVQFILALPCEQRLPNGRMKRLLRDALSACLPACIAERRQVTTFEANIELQFRRSVPAVTAILQQTPWHSAPYVDRAGAGELLNVLTAAPAGTLDWTEVATLWNIALLENWLQRWRPHLGSVP